MSKHLLNLNFFIEEDEQEDGAWQELSIGKFIPDVLFKNIIFTHETSYLLNGKETNIVIVFSPIRDKTFIINKIGYKYFIKKHFSNEICIRRKPDFYMFTIPIPSYSYVLSPEYSYSTGDDDILIAKTQNGTYQMINNSQFESRLSINSYYLLKKSFDRVFQATFQNIVEISDQYRIYLSNILLVDKEKIVTESLIYPYYKLNKDELSEVCKYLDEIMDLAYKEEVKRSLGRRE